MLSRIANNLYWAGRYLERMEHVTRYVPVLYFSALDGPEVINSQYVLKAINDLSGSNFDKKDQFLEREVLFDIAFNRANPSSLISCINLVRENCRGARDILSTELWEAINRLYHFVHNYDQEAFLSTTMQKFMIELQTMITVCKARIQSTMIQNQVWSILITGILVERGAQIVRIIDYKFEALSALGAEQNIALETYEIANLLKSLESYDMNRKFYKNAVNRERALEFLLLNEKFPRSLLYCIRHICRHLNELGIDQKGLRKSVKLSAQNFENELQYSSVSEIVSNPSSYLSHYGDVIANMNTSLVENYFSK